MAWVTTPTNGLVLHFEDYNGKRATSSYRIDATEVDPAAGAAAAIADAAQAMSAAELTSQEIIITAVKDDAGMPTDGPYARGADKAMIVFRTTSGRPVNFQIGSPDETILGADHLNVDPSDAAMAALITTFVSKCCDADGDAITGFQRGYRRRPPRRKHK